MSFCASCRTVAKHVKNYDIFVLVDCAKKFWLVLLQMTGIWYWTRVKYLACCQHVDLHHLKKYGL